MSGLGVLFGIFIIAVIALLIWHYYLCIYARASRAVDDAKNAILKYNITGSGSDMSTAKTLLKNAANLISEAAVSSKTKVVSIKDLLVLDPVPADPSDSIIVIVKDFNSLKDLARIPGNLTPSMGHA